MNGFNSAEAFLNDNKHLFAAKSGPGMSMGSLPFSGSIPSNPFNMNSHHTTLHPSHHSGAPSSVNMAPNFALHSHFAANQRRLMGDMNHSQSLPQNSNHHSSNNTSNNPHQHSSGSSNTSSTRPPKNNNQPPKQFHCPICHKIFTQKGNLKTHMMIHNGDKPYACHVCGKSFTQKGNVDTHIKIHTGVKDYNCPSCGKTFTQKGNLKTHVRSVHTKEKPFACNVCGKSFSQRGNMHTHIRTHNKDDRFPCQLCGKTFSQKGNLKTHMQRHAGTLPKRNPNSKRQTTSRLLQVPAINTAINAAYAIAQQQHALQVSQPGGHQQLNRTNSGSPNNSENKSPALSMLNNVTSRASLASQSHSLANGAGLLFGSIQHQSQHQHQQQPPGIAVSSANDASASERAAAAINLATFPRFF